MTSKGTLGWLLKVWGICLSMMLIWMQLGCTASYPVRTVGRGNLAAQGSLGGPLLTNFGTPFPAPNLFLGARYGVSEKLDVGAQLNLTSPILPGFLDIQTEVYYAPIQPAAAAGLKARGLEVLTTGTIHWMTNVTDGFRMVPAVQGAVGYRLGRFNPYLGTTLAVLFWPAFDRDVPLMLTPYAGLEVLLSERWSLAVQASAYDVGYNHFASSAKYLYLYDKPEELKRYGPLGITLGVSRAFKLRD